MWACLWLLVVDLENLIYNIMPVLLLFFFLVVSGLNCWYVFGKQGAI
jgi:hypothetical protein